MISYSPGSEQRFKASTKLQGSPRLLGGYPAFQRLLEIKPHPHPKGSTLFLGGLS